jgi:hypothetical protein
MLSRANVPVMPLKMDVSIAIITQRVKVVLAGTNSPSLEDIFHISSSLLANFVLSNKHIRRDQAVFLT